MDKLVRFILWTCIVTGAFVGILRLVFIRWWQVPNDDPVLQASVAPTVRGGDWVLLWRFTPPRFGGLVVCPDPEDPSAIVIGRIAGEEGDHVAVEGDNVLVNDHQAETEMACAEHTFTIEHPTTGAEVEQTCTIEAFGGVAHQRGNATGRRMPRRTERDVGEGKVFLLSDNRAFPFDSRHYGSVDRDTCKESIFFRLWSDEGFFDVKNRFTYIR